MADTIEKIYCSDRGDDNALTAAILSNNRRDDGFNRADLLLQNCKDTAELRNGQRDLGAAITQGFSATAFQAQQDKCDIIRAGQDNTQRIIDTLNTHWKDEQAREIQDLKAQISQLKQTDAIIARLQGNGCGCNNGCSGGF